MKRADISKGDVYSELTVVSVPTSKGTRAKRVKILCVCTCGEYTEVLPNRLTSGNTKSCGCYRTTHPSRKTHGLASHPLYSVWNSMRKRCYDENHGAFKRYGAVGRTVCREWLDGVENFYSWALNNGWKKGLQLDRIDNSKGYSPNNCRFVTPQQNAHNKDVVGPRNKSGFAGVWFDRKRNLFRSGVSEIGPLLGNKRKHLGRFHTALEAVIARDKFIIENKLKYHKLQVLTKEEK